VEHGNVDSVADAAILPVAKPTSAVFVPCAAEVQSDVKRAPAQPQVIPIPSTAGLPALPSKSIIDASKVLMGVLKEVQNEDVGRTAKKQNSKAGSVAIVNVNSQYQHAEEALSHFNYAGKTKKDPLQGLVWTQHLVGTDNSDEGLPERQQTIRAKNDNDLSPSAALFKLPGTSPLITSTSTPIEHQPNSPSAESPEENLIHSRASSISLAEFQARSKSESYIDFGSLLSVPTRSQSLPSSSNNKTKTVQVTVPRPKRPSTATSRASERPSSSSTLVKDRRPSSSRPVLKLASSELGQEAPAFRPSSAKPGLELLRPRSSHVGHLPDLALRERKISSATSTNGKPSTIALDRQVSFGSMLWASSSSRSAGASTCVSRPTSSRPATPGRSKVSNDKDTYSSLLARNDSVETFLTISEAESDATMALETEEGKHTWKKTEVSNALEIYVFTFV
jgi:hypothetical protein